MIDSPVIQETKAQRAERLKREKNPWECLAEIRRFAREGYGSIPPEWLGTYFRWWGVYTQGDGLGAVGGKGGEGRAVPYFMVRIRIPNGILRSDQLRRIAGLAARYARGVGDITVRQNIQLHWVTIEALPDLLAGLCQAGLTSMGACGDITRNITGCPVAGVDRDELVDASPLVQAATLMLNGNAAFYNLPRKYKICITGCRAWCSYPEINDVGLTAITRERGGRSEVGFSLRVGGGLSTDPHLATRLDAFVRWEQVVHVVRGITEIFRESEILRENRKRARLKFLFLRHGWTPERFQKELELRLGFPLDPAAPEEAPDDVYRDHVGIHPQRQEGTYYAGMAVLRGRLTSEQMVRVAELADRYGSGELRTTGMQNLILLDVLRRDLDELSREANDIGLPLFPSRFWRGAIACTGTEFCKLAITETKGYARWLVGELEERLPGFGQHLKIHITGCPNSCGQHWIADLGLEGKKVHVNGAVMDAYYFCIGGGLGKHQTTARPIGFRCSAAEVPDAIERLLRAYLDGRQEDENFRQYCARYSEGALRAIVAGREIEPALRDPSPGRVPHGVEG